MINNLEEFYAHETAIIDEGAIIGKGTKIWHFSHIMSKSKIGENCNIGQNVVISPDVIIGDNTKIQNNVSVYTGVICEDDVFMGPSMVFTNVINPRSAVNRKAEYMQTYVKRGATFGANCTIVCGTTIGEYAFIGAGAVITKDVKAYALIVGNPGKQIGWMSEYGQRLEFDKNGIAICPESKEKYEMKNNEVKKIA
jgi:UDP-2-acetamido-3-amino-2,3-dideoxy-glucuronate N-acetyltransferase